MRPSTKHRIVHGPTRLLAASARPICESLDRRLLMAAGDPDNTFNNGFPAVINFPGGSFQVNDVALQSDGKVIVVGTKALGIAVTRFNSDGSLDTTFGNGGLFESGARAQATSVAIQQDNKILITFGAIESFGNMQVGRLHASGSGFDTTFGNAGVASVSGVLFNSSNTVAVQNDGKIVVGGYRNSGSWDFEIARYNANGSPDTSFDDDGLVVLGFGEDEQVLALAIDYNGTAATNPLFGSIVAVGDKRSGSTNPSSRFTICRLRPNGTPDSSFDGDGKLTSPDLSPDATEFATGVQIQPGGKIVVSGTAIGTGGGNILLARYLPSGAIDGTFGPFGSGIVHDHFGGDERAADLAPSYLGGLLVSGSRDGSAAVAAYTIDGMPETRFGGGDGFATGAFSGLARMATSLNAIAPIRRLILAANNRVGRYVDVGSVVSVGSFDPNAAEQGQDTATLTAVRTERLETTERIYISISGLARPPYLLNADYTVSGMTLVHPFQGRSYIDILPNQTVATATITPNDDSLVEGDETVIMSVAGDNSYDIGTNASAPMVIRDNDDSGGPALASSQFVYETAPQRVLFRFSQDVGASVTAGDFQVSGPAGNVAFGFVYDEIQNTATLTFGNILPDGNYTARAIAAGITNAAGQPLAADGVLGFFAFAGDANRDRIIDIGDFAIVAGRFNLPGTFSQGDFDYNGVTDIGDFAILASKFNQTLPLPRISPAGGPKRSTHLRQTFAEAIGRDFDEELLGVPIEESSTATAIRQSP